ncbi:MAG: CHAD domain-containing protein [Proteobacteria bacterium]|nr:CHAD domain-containing protein [Pseudomonadota bacterium]
MTDTGHPTEIELKLRIPPDAVERLKRLRLLKRLGAGKPQRVRLVSTYFDTPDFRLMRNQVALRVRKIGEERVQTVKCAAEAKTGLLARREWEKPVVDDRPQLDDVGDRKVRKLLARDKVRRYLMPLFTTDFERSTFPLRLRDSAIELAVDVGEIKTDTRRMAVCEAELELKSGSVGDVYALARELHQSIGLTIEPATKAERGYALLADVPSPPQKAALLKLPRSVTLGEAFARIGRTCLMHWRANEAVVRAGGPEEAVHQMRVAIRRLRSALTAFRAMLADEERRRIAAELRWIARQCGEAREWDVFESEFLAPLRERLADDPALARFAEAVATARRAAHDRIAKTLTDPAYTDRLLRLEVWWEGGGWTNAAGIQRDEPASDFARRALQRLHRRLRRLGDRLDALTEADLHELRLRAKKLRYAAEFFASLYPAKAARSYIAALAQIQDRLGSLNDGVMVPRRLAAIERGRPAIDREVLARASGIITGWTSAQIKADLEKLPEAWTAFADVRPFWK